MSRKRKRRLTEEELREIRAWTAATGKKPTVRQIARKFGVNQPSVIKSLDGWKGIHRGKRSTAKKKSFEREFADNSSPIKIEGYTTEVDTDKLQL